MGSSNRRQFLKSSAALAVSTIPFAGLSPVLFLAGCGKKQTGKKPNIILITVDTLKADHLKCYGYHRDTSPNIDRFADDSMLFERCFSHAPETRNSFASILSGFLPHETGVTNILPRTVKTLPKMLREHGYKTGAVVSNYVLSGKYGWGEGFMVYDDTMNKRELTRKWPEKNAEHTTDGAIAILKKFYGEQFFLWVHYQDPHGPYAPPPRFAKLFVDPNQERYDLKVNETATGYGGIPNYQKLSDRVNFF